MPGIVRVGDVHAGICSHGIPDCCPHGVVGTYITGSNNVFINGRAVVRVGDPVVHSCPHCGVGAAATGSGTVFVNGVAVHRVGDGVVYLGGAGVATVGSGDVIAK